MVKWYSFLIERYLNLIKVEKSYLKGTMGKSYLIERYLSIMEEWHSFLKVRYLTLIRRGTAS